MYGHSFGCTVPDVVVVDGAVVAEAGDVSLVLANAGEIVAASTASVAVTPITYFFILNIPFHGIGVTGNPAAIECAPSVGLWFCAPAFQRVCPYL